MHRCYFLIFEIWKLIALAWWDWVFHPSTYIFVDNLISRKKVRHYDSWLNNSFNFASLSLIPINLKRYRILFIKPLERRLFIETISNTWQVNNEDGWITSIVFEGNNPSPFDDNVSSFREDLESFSGTNLNLELFRFHLILILKII